MYLDSCIIVKLLVVEPDSGLFVQRLTGTPLTTSELSRVEVFSALLTRERAGKISTADRRRAWQEFETRANAGEVKIESLNSIVISKATHLLEKCHPQIPLRSLDAIHLATADLRQDFPLVTTDARLRDAANLLGFDIFPPTGNAPVH
jgi:predicted nucleic acid-binding protein